MKIIKAMGKALLAILLFVIIVKLIILIVEISKIDPINGLVIISLIWLFLMLTAYFYKLNNKE